MLGAIQYSFSMKAGSSTNYHTRLMSVVVSEHLRLLEDTETWHVVLVVSESTSTLAGLHMYVKDGMSVPCVICLLLL